MKPQPVNMKENSKASDFEAVVGRVTRARAAALCTMNASSNESNSASSHKKNQNVADSGGRQGKRKAVLQDVTNILCDSSYNNCFNATKLSAKRGKQVKKTLMKASNGMKSVSMEILKPQRVPKAKIARKASREEECSQKITQAMNPDQNVSSQLSKSDDADRCLSIKENGRADMEETSLDDQEITNINADETNHLLCSIYAPEIYNNLHFTELVRRPKCGFMETVQRDITKGMRGVLIDWLVEVSQEYSLSSDTLYITVHLIDWYLSQNLIQRHRLQLLGITCLLIASKYEEICTPRVDELCFMTDNTYTKEEVLRMEGQLLNYFGFRITVPTIKTFLRRFLLAAQVTCTCPSVELEYLADYLAELTLIEYDFLNFLPSVIAASAVFLAKWTLDSSHHPWNPTLEHYTRCKVSELKTTVYALQDLQLNSKGCPLNAIRTKYRQQKFKSVASLSPRKLPETLF